MVSVQIEKLEEYAHDNNIPIMMKDGINFLKDYIKKHNVKKILEIGTAIGYSSIMMCLDSDASVVTIERDEKRYIEALKNIKDFNLENRIKVIFKDAFDTEITDTYDLIFIDAAKSQSIKFFNKFKSNLNKDGAIITDNLNFHGLTHTDKKIESKNVRGLVRKINEYITFLKENDEFKTTFLEIGDGISLSIRNN